MKLFNNLCLFVLAMAQVVVASDNHQLIDSIEVQKHHLKIVVNNYFKSRYLVDDFFAEYDEDINLEKFDRSIQIIPFILNVLPIIWISGENYYVDSMDEDTYHSLERIKKVFVRMYPKTSWNGNLIAGKLVKNGPMVPLKDSEYNRAVLYSGGLDSMCASLIHTERGEKQLLLTAWGQWDVPLEKRNLWEIRKNSFTEFAQRYGYSNAFVKSNYACFLHWDVLESLSAEIKDWRVDTTEGMGMMGLALPIMLTKGYQMLHIASTYTWHYPYPSSAGPLVDNNLVCAGGFRLRHDQYDMTRFEKIAYMAKKVGEGKADCLKMKVCDGQRSSNCCDDCKKCVQTMLGLLVLGEDIRKYGFDISRKGAIEKAKEFMVHGSSCWVMWNIKKIVNYLKELCSKGKKVPSDLLWLLDIDLARIANMKYECNKTALNWADFRDLAAEDLVIPHYKLEKDL